jgi:two-component system, NtrC family, sensor kinase
MLETLNSELEQRVEERTEELRKSEEQFRMRAELLELASDAIMVRDMKGSTQFWNAGAEALYGWSREEMLGKDIHGILADGVSRFEKTRWKLHCASNGSWQGT